jgi:hypothetical protein
MLTLWGLPGDSANAIEAKQTELRAQPEVTVGSLSNRAYVAFGESVADLPRGMRVLANIERWI